MADNENKLRKGEDTWRKEDTCIKEKLEDKEGRRETERIEEREGRGEYEKEKRGEKMGIRIGTRERHTMLRSGRKEDREGRGVT